MPQNIPTKFQQYNFIETRDKHNQYVLPPPKFGKATQTPKSLDPGDLLQKLHTKYVQHIVGSLSFYVRVTDATILKTLDSLSQQ